MGISEAIIFIEKMLIEREIHEEKVGTPEI